MDLERQIFDQLKRIHKLQAWEDFEEAQIFGLQLPRKKDPYFISIIGQLGPEVGVGIFRGKLGLAYFFEQMQMNIQKKESFYGQDMILVSFEDREDLTKDQYDRIKDSGITFRGRKSWPVISDISPGYTLLDLRDDRKRLELTQVLEALLDVLEDFYQEGIEETFQKYPDLPVKVVEDTGISTYNMTDINQLALGVDAEGLSIRPAYFPRYEMTKARLQDQVSLYWELAFYRVPIVVEDDLSEDGRPAFPYFLVLTEPKSDRIISLDLFVYEDYLTIQDVFFQSILLEGYRPSHIRILEKGSQLVLAYLSDLFKQLNIDYRIASQLPYNQSVAEDLLTLDYFNEDLY